MEPSCTFRHASVDDVVYILTLGNSIPELKVSADADFMTRDELVAAVRDPRGIFFVAESDGEILGFCYANTEDLGLSIIKGCACLVYLAVHPEHRSSGLGGRLYTEMVAKLKSRGVSNVYAWANPDSGIIEFLQRRGWDKGHACVWMDAKI